MDFDKLRKKEFSRLDALDQVYLDYTGSGLYSKWQIDQHFKYLYENVLGNPHTFSPSSVISTEHIERARKRVLDFFNADPQEYEVIFTQNATAALKLIGESYPFDEDSAYVLTSDNHNSVNGIREFALKRKAKVKYIPLDFNLGVNDILEYLPPGREGINNLFAFPAQSNFSGTRYPLEWIHLAHSRHYDVILDAAAFVPTNKLDLRRIKPDFVPISFYKMFGYPTGVGALIARTAAISKLKRPWFSGGTIDLVTTKYFYHHFIEGPQAFEDGTPNFLDIPAISFGLSFLEKVGMDNIHNHVIGLSKKLTKALRELRHSNGNPLTIIYGPDDPDKIGSTIALNVLTPAGTIIDSRLIGKLAKENRISIRTGCFCNPGSGEHFFGYSENDEEKCIRKFSNGKHSLEEFPQCVGGLANGAVRVSLGIATNEKDIKRFIDLLGSLKDCQEDISERENLPVLSC
ncbi:MAG: aminotransferase class V-fold PLP-dependent enzyme [Candidatus Bathyarchaeia archaeon]